MPALLEIVQAAYRGEGGWTTEAHLVRGVRADEVEMRSLLADPDVLLLAAECLPPWDLAPPMRLTEQPDGTEQSDHTEQPEDAPRQVAPGTLVGCCYTRRDHTDPTRAELGLFAVDPSLQGRGVGRMLLEEHAAHRAAEGVQTLELCVLQNRPELRAWYERCGFRATGDALPFPADPALLIDPQLRMEAMERPLGLPAR